MQRTLFFIPHELGPLPVFGNGWALIALGAGFALRAFLASRSAKSPHPGDSPKDSDGGGSALSEMLASEGLFWAVAAAIVSRDTKSMF